MNEVATRITLEEMLAELTRYGKVHVYSSTRFDGTPYWQCSCELHIESAGSTLRVRAAGDGHYPRSLGEAVRLCLDRVTALREA